MNDPADKERLWKQVNNPIDLGAHLNNLLGKNLAPPTTSSMHNIAINMLISNRERNSTTVDSSRSRNTYEIFPNSFISQTFTSKHLV